MTRGMKVRRVPDSNCRHYCAAFSHGPGRPDIQVDWWTSHEGGLLGSASVMIEGRSTHARTLVALVSLIEERSRARDLEILANAPDDQPLNDLELTALDRERGRENKV